ncbi:PREDICTED: TBCC domain-containing protein 1-like [Acropora digitifera]|uniref:TBCC domain-containing protein 1-like n=1 Tax=Acropora digitifera TaxID=70779 RepID=UPI00077ABA3F|nr:PREDICTED: TBCC domain-containing protein 1-like [Acropora digitifera]
MSSICLWVKPDPFEFGAIHAPLPPKLTLHNLYKLSIYARNKGKAGYPKLSYSVWKHVACNKLQISEDLAWLYFETFDMLSASSFKEHLNWNKQFAQCNTEEDLSHLRSQGFVMTLQFILFLYIQQIHKISFKASLVLGGEEWPTRSRSPDLENKGSVAVKVGPNQFLSLSDTFEEHVMLRHQETDHGNCSSKEHPSHRCRIMSNVSYAPLEQRIIILSQVCKQTVAKASDSYSGSMVKIHRCHYSYIYILCPLRAVTVENCHNSTIVLGVTKTAVNVIGCDSCSFFAVCDRVSISGCSNCSFHLCTPTRPVILPGNEKLVLAPYYTYYPTLEEHLKGPWGVPTDPNLWNDPLVLVSEDTSTVYRELSPQDFFTFTIPFSMKGSTDGPPIPLPKKYEKALKERERAINNWYQLVKTSSLSKEQRRQLQKDVQERFQVWLAESGHATQLNGLVPSHISQAQK